jgi:hypothetical protein
MTIIFPSVLEFVQIIYKIIDKNIKKAFDINGNCTESSLFEFIEKVNDRNNR